MATAVKAQSNSASRTQKKQSASNTQQEPKRLSKAGQWMSNNPGGILEYVDWRAVNK